MLVEFRVKNFRSFRDEQVFSLVASKDKTSKETHTFETGIKAVPSLLRSGVVYGSNASGKSNLIKALQYMRNVVQSSATLEPAQQFLLQPFRLDSNSSKKETEFEATFIVDGVRHQYGFSMTSERITREYLLVYKAFKPQRWFDRYFDVEADKDVYEYGAGLKGPKNLWEGATRPNSLFLSMAVQLNSASLRPVFDWFAERLVIFNEQTSLNPQVSIDMLKTEDGRKKICKFLSSADISIDDINVITKKVPAKTWHLDLANGGGQIQDSEMDEHQLLFSHVTPYGRATFTLGDESSGTRSLLFIAGPILQILERGEVLVVDELDTSLHTLLVRELVRLFHDPETNTGGAQLIFSTHDTSLLDAYGLFRRDQIWFVEKDQDQASSLVSLAEFGVRKDEALERNYVAGRYGGIPFLRGRLRADL